MDVYLVFSKTGTWLSTLLRSLLKEKYIHVSVAFNDKFDCMYSFGRVNPNNPFSGGFVTENFRTGVYKKFKKAECIIYKIQVTKEQYEQLFKELEKYQQRKEELKYNFLGLIVAFFHFRWVRQNHYFCSQFVSKLLIDTDIINTSKPPEFFRPKDILLTLKEYEKIYEGYISDYVTNYDENNKNYK